ncbi:NAD(+) diphosphatase [Naasia sp. SYSU D00948]|uniref:NAD(+) diphosphatase n=1 Tax=Naasia sp. SYSU D00948 TaxID=2817379 RepID=UPI001B304D25|nr:NAD(+) diphosphatase [Naasia sp. SYSU D00948]
MTGSLTSRLALSRSAVDRDYLTRSRPGLVDELRADPLTRAVVLRRGSALMEDGDRPRLRLVPLASLPGADLLVYLGRALEGQASGAPIVAAVVDEAAAAALEPDPERWGDLRRLGADLDALDAGLFTQALAITNWHASHGYSPRTGQPTLPAQGGWVRHPEGQDDEAGGHHVFPRTDPAVIMGVVDGQDRLLLGANALWGGERYSILAGFVEPGESLESAVIREVREESGLTVVDPVYVGSQPWPFPASIMIGFRARLDPAGPAEPVPDGVELIDLRWFSRDELTDANRTIGIPGRTSIARAIIEQWFGGPLDAP